MAKALILMTAAINPGDGVPYLVIADKNKRWIQYLESLICWIREPAAEKIVFCDNTGAEVDYTPIQNFAKEHGKQLEVLVYRDNLNSKKWGKGYGEGEILNYILKTSEFVRSERSFYKITGRLFIPEFSALHARFEKAPLIFYDKHYPRPSGIYEFSKRVYMRLAYRRYSMNGALETRFYKTDIEFYKAHLSRTHRSVRDLQGYTLEHAFYDAFFPYRDQLKYELDVNEVKVMGYSASLGKLCNGGEYPEEVSSLAKSMC